MKGEGLVSWSQGEGWRKRGVRVPPEFDEQLEL